MSEKEKKTESALLKEKLFEQPKNGWLRVDEKEIDKIYSFAEGYMDFLGRSKTEREVCANAIEAAKAAGFTEFDKTRTYKPGDKVYRNNRGKSLLLAVIGSESIANGVRIAAAHIDSPRLDLKQHPLYEDSELAYLKTHYYGGLRKYQWPVMPLALHGTIVRADGQILNICLGENADEPCFVISDLLPHLAVEQSKRTLNQGIKGEELNILIGSRPFNADKESEQVKLNIMRLINEKYGLVESDFISCELEAVPVGKPRDIGFDRSLVGAYGHDDRVCAYPSLMAVIAANAPKKTTVCALADKEETGSDGNTGMQSAALKYFVADLAEMSGCKGRDVLSKSECLSADVNAAFDPNFAEPFEKRNSSQLNYGAVITKFTGHGGKYDTSDASAEFTGKIRLLMDKNNVVWQTGELGKVDNGGGGTVAKYIANLNVDVIDLGVPVLSMHSPFEVISKLDLYMTYRAVYEFFAE